MCAGITLWHHFLCVASCAVLPMPQLRLGPALTPLPCNVASTVAGVSFAWTIVISVMRGALDGMQQPAPTTVQLEQAVADVAAAALAADAAAATALAAVEALPAGTAAAGPSSAAAAVAAAAEQLHQQQQQLAAAAAPAVPQGQGQQGSSVLAAAGGMASGSAHAAKAGLKALVPRPHVAAAVAAEAAG